MPVIRYVPIDDLTAANERNREFEEKYHAEYQAATTARADAALYQRRVVELEGMYERKSASEAAERAISDKLEKAVGEVLAFRVGSLPTLGYIRDTDGSRASINSLAAALAEVAAMRKGEQG